MSTATSSRANRTTTSPSLKCPSVPATIASGRHIRTTMRWMKHEGLIRHEKTRFSAATGGSLRKAVAAAWKRLESEN